MEMLLFRITGLRQNWIILCPADRKERLKEVISKIKSAAGRILWLPYTPQGIT
jgi:hypothetical protein